ncbi:MAG: T9SS type A sorting domain-containing protein [Chitinophagales bacterium]|jgi:hypothetical protein|nr:T9SS type A sorting domain-containing protein [Chitinophagales bacterium]
MKTLKHIILSVAAILAATDFSFSQSYSITPNDTFEVVGYLEDLQTLTISQQNNTADTLYFQWKKVSESVPANWEASVCDNEVCYVSLVDSGTTNPVFPTEAGFILLHVTPHVNYGTAIIRYAIWDINNPILKDTLTFITTATAPSAITETGSKSTFATFPNPANNNINIQFSDNEEYNMAIFNPLGQWIFSGVFTANSQLSTANWLNGIYTISISDNKSSFTKKIIIQH